MDEAEFRLKHAGIDPCWVESLCPADLFHYLGLHMRLEREHLRNDLAVAAAAAKAPHDKGESVKALMKHLAPADDPADEAPAGPTSRDRASQAGTFGEAMAVFDRLDKEGKSP